MTIQFWRLSEATDDNLGLACTADGLLLGRTPIVARRGQHFVVREQYEIERLFSRAFGDAAAVERIMSGLGIVAAALNADDRCLAAIAAVHLRIPALPDFFARDRMEAEDALIKYARGEEPASEWDPAKHPRAGTAPNPGWFAPTEGEDDKASPVRMAENEKPNEQNDAEKPGQSESRIMRQAARRAAKTISARALRMGIKALAGLVPAVGQLIAAFIEAAEVVGTIDDVRQLADEINAALDFLKKGPHNLQELQVPSHDYQEFSNYGQFIKLKFGFEATSKRFGSAGDGYQYHHIVTQGGANERNIPPEQLQNTENIIRLPTLLHEAVNDAYSERKGDTNITVYEWIQTQPYNVQREEGLKILRELHIIE